MTVRIVLVTAAGLAWAAALAAPPAGPVPAAVAGSAGAASFSTPTARPPVQLGGKAVRFPDTRLIPAAALVTGTAGTASAYPSDPKECAKSCDARFPKQGQRSFRNACKATCYTNEAKRRKDAELCKPVLEQDRVAWASHVGCLVEVGAVTGDPAVCGKASGDLQRNLCLKELARRRKDVSFCERIEDATIRLDCRALLGR